MTEIKIKEKNKTHVADIFLQNNNPYKIVDDMNKNIFNISYNNLVIEIQHSNISLSDVEQRENFYCKDDMLTYEINSTYN